MKESTAKPAAVSLGTARAWLLDREEIAAIDVRDLADFSAGHFWFAVNVPYGRLELLIRRFVPRLSARVLLCGGSDDLNRRATRILSSIGYTDISYLEESADPSDDSELRLITGNYVVQHSFGYFLKHRFDIPLIDAKSLKAKIDQGTNVKIFDTRPHEDYLRGSIPGSTNVPAAELVSIVRGIVPDPATEIIVHCGGITRGMLGAHALRMAEIENPVSVLDHGTKGWMAAGFDLMLPHPDPVQHTPMPASSLGPKTAAKLSTQYGIKSVTLSELETLQNTNANTTFYLIDIRPSAQYRLDHVPSAISVPGEELAGMTIDHLATRNSVLCLVGGEDTGAAEITAAWMLHLGWEVLVIRDWNKIEGIEGGPEKIHLAPAIETVPKITAEELAKRRLSENIQILDFARSDQHRTAHIPGATWALRTDIPEILQKISPGTPIVVVSQSGRVAETIAPECQDVPERTVLALTGGTDAWLQAGLEFETGIQCRHTEIRDKDAMMVVPNGNSAEAIRFLVQYNRWREGLYAQFLEQKLVQFRTLPQIQNSRC